jgi:hypothetical protein
MLFIPQLSVAVGGIHVTVASQVLSAAIVTSGV